VRKLCILTAAALILVASLLPAPVSAGRASAPDAPSQEAQYAPDQLLVKLADSGPSALPPGFRVLREIPELGLALVEVSSAGEGGLGGQGLPVLTQAAAQLTEEPGIEWAEPNYTIELDLTPNDPGYSAWQSPYLSRLGAAAAWDLTTGRPETIIAVLDTGVDMTHEDLSGAFWTNPGETAGNNIDDDGNGFVDDVKGWDFADNDNAPDDDHGHGTHVAGIAAARIDNGKGIAGMAGHATIMPVDVFQHGIGTYEALIRAIIYATDNGARVINMSLGATSYSRGEEAAVDYAYDHGVVVVAAAGNSGREQIHYPGAHPHAIAVASTTYDDFFSTFSTRGDWVDVAAPGSSIYSTTRYNAYGLMSGTSMATPHVSGLAALILSRNPTLTPDQVRSVIESTVDDLEPAGHDIFYGAGRINAGRALAATPPNDDPPPVPPPGPGQDVDLPGCTELLENGGFETDLTGWQGDTTGYKVEDGKILGDDAMGSVDWFVEGVVGSPK
jgi:subtilisin family serine protease